MEEYKVYFESKLFKRGDFIIEIKYYDVYVEAWLQHKEFGVSNLMFAVPYRTSTYSNSKFIQMVENHLDEHIASYKEEVMKGEDL